MKEIFIFSLFFLSIECTRKTDRDYLNFKDDLAVIENSILTIDSLLHLLPKPLKHDRIQSIFYKVSNSDTILFVNSDSVGNIHKIPLDSLANVLQMDIKRSIRFKDASLILLRNDIGSILNDYSGWHYVYKISSDRGQYRPLLYNYNNDYIQFRIDSCRYKIIDMKGNIILFKHEDEPTIPRKAKFL